MDERQKGAATDAVLVSEAFSTARELLQRAEADAARIRADADRYRRQREQEAELLVSKARRLLEVAEERAAGLSATPPPMVIDVDAPIPVPDAAPAEAWRLDDPPGLDHEPVAPGSLRTPSDLDSILATAVSNAISRALPNDR